MKNITYRDIILAGVYMFFVLLITSISIMTDETYKPIYFLLTLVMAAIPTSIGFLFMLPTDYGDAWFEENPIKKLFY